jgi:hypothetical protein
MMSTRSAWNTSSSCVANITDGLAGDGAVIQFGLGSDFATHHDKIALGVSFTGDAAEFVLRQARVQDVIGNGIANLVRMAFPDGLRRKDIVFAHLITARRFDFKTHIDASGCEDIYLTQRVNS